LLRAELLCLILQGAGWLIVRAMHFHVLVVGDGVDEAEDVLAAVGVKAIEENGVGSAVFAGQLKFRITYDDFAFVVDAKFRAHLQNNFHFLACGHGAPQFA
jgi:hypothetical protein